MSEGPGWFARLVARWRAWWRRPLLRLGWIEPPPRFNLPRPGRIFEGRASALQDVRAALRDDGGAVLVAVQGMGGIGKTELAVQYADAHLADYPGGIFFVNAEGDVPAQGLVDLLHEGVLGVHKGDGSTEQQIETARMLLGQRRALLILDNVTNVRDVLGACPLGWLCHVLITTRRHIGREGFRPIRVGELSPLAALDVLQQKAPAQTTGAHEADAVYLADLVGHLPLALHMAGAYLAEQEVAAGVLVAAIEAQVEGLHTAMSEPPDTDAAPTTVKTTVRATFATSWTQLAYDEQRLLALACRFAPTPFPERLLEGAARWLEALESGQEELAEETPRWFAAGVKRLRRRHLLLEDEESGWLRVHRLVRGFVREQMSEEVLEGAFVREMIRVCQYELRITEIPFGVAMREHLELAHEGVVGVLGTHRHIVWPATVLGRLGEWTADQESRERWCRAALALVDEEHSQHAAMLNNLGLLLQAKGDFDAAEPLYRRDLAISETMLGPDHRDVATSLNNLGHLLQTKGDFDAAEPLLRRALAISESALGENHPDVATSLSGLGHLLKAKGDLDAAEPLLRRALAIGEATLGPDHPAVATRLSNLGNVLQDKGDLDGAEPLMRRALAIGEKALGENHPSVATRLNNLGTLLYARSDYAGALALQERALAIAQARLPADHPNIRLYQRNVTSARTKLS